MEVTATELLVVRHGESEGNAQGKFGGHGPTPLTDRGRRQAERVAALVARLEPTALISSDSVRAMSTAEAIGRATGLSALPEPRLRERCLGIFDDLSFTEVAERYPVEWQRLSGRDLAFCPEGGETIDFVFERVGAALRKIVEAHPGGRVAVVSHGIAIFHMFAHVTGLGSPGRGLQVFTLVDNCSLSRFRHRDGRWVIRSLNERAHLEGIE
jgi:probable phosphoglycerate mutase